MAWEETLKDVFYSYVGQESLGDAAYQLAFVASDNPEYHRALTMAFEEGIRAARAGEQKVNEIIGSSGGYGVNTSAEAVALLSKLSTLYSQKRGEILSKYP